MQLRRGNPSIALETMLPFVRTPLNILEQGLQRTLGLGFIVHKIAENHGKIPDSTFEKVVQQGLGAVMATAGYTAGLVVPPEQASTWRRYLSNGAGQYSALIAIGFAAGQGAQRTGDGPVSGLVSPEAVRQLTYSFPLPVAEPITNLFTMAGQLYNGRPLSPPSGLVPQQGLDIMRYMKSEEAEPVIPGIPRGRFRKIK